MLESLTREEPLETRWNTWLEPGWIAALDETPFLSRCRKGEVSSEELACFAAQQYHYSRHFTRYLCALLSNVVNEGDRRELTENLVDETGLGTEKGIPHSTIYRSMLGKLGVDPADHPVLPETQRLIDTMLESCRNPNAAVGLGALCLGAEAIVPHVYSQVVRGFEARGETRDTLEFFHLHIGCDDEHAETMKAIIEREMTSSEQKLTLRCSAARAIAARVRFFRGLTKQGELAYA
jgi:pyrroloquinoline-quinone synthase